MKEKISNIEFRMMQGFMALLDHMHHYVGTKAETFGLRNGMTVVDYGCGPGRYTVEFARLVGSEGKVYAVDILDIALKETEKRLRKFGMQNVILKQANGYDTGIMDGAADIVFAIDMFHHVSDTDAFLREIYRISKPDALLIFSGGHQSPAVVKTRIASTGLWLLTDDNRGFLEYRKANTII